MLPELARQAIQFYGSLLDELLNNGIKPLGPVKPRDLLWGPWLELLVRGVSQDSSGSSFKGY